MKKLILSVMLVVALLVMAPAGVAAAPEKAQKAKTVDLQLYVVAIDRQQSEPEPVGFNEVRITGTVTYTGQVTSVKLGGVKEDAKLVESLMDAKLLAVEKFDYIINYDFMGTDDIPDGTIINGTGVGTLRLIDKKDARDVKDLRNMKDARELKKVKELLERNSFVNYMAIRFQADISGNILTGPASDVGSWEVIRTFGGYSRLNNAEGDWTAYVEIVDLDGPGPMPETFAGMVSCVGTY